MASEATATTFAFSDDELLDALKTFDDDDVDLTALDKLAVPSLPTTTLASHHSTFEAITLPPPTPLDVDDSASTDSSSEQSSTVDTESVANDGGSPTRRALGKPSRKRRKHELDAMRELAANLEQQLATLKKRHHQERPGTNLFWKRVADQLSLDRQRAMAEKAKLQDVFEDQVKVLKSIQRSIQKSPDLEKLGIAPAQDAPLSISESPEIYNRLFEEVEHAYQGTDTVMEKAGINKDAESRRRVNMDMRTEDGRSVMTMEVAESKIVDADVFALGDGVWDFLSKSSCQNDANEVFKRTFKARGDDAFGVIKIGCAVGLHTLNADVAVRRFTDGRRLTFVWECAGRCDNDSNPEDAFRLQEKGWAVFEPSATADPSSKKSVFRSCVQFIPKPMDPSKELGTLAKDIGLATEVILSVYEKTIGTMYDNILSELMSNVAITAE